MNSASPFYELQRHCPQVGCGVAVEITENVQSCPRCSKEYQNCASCRATNRVFVEYCRNCGETLYVEGWPMQPGLAASATKRHPIRDVGDVIQRKLEMTVVAPPVALDGLVVVAGYEGEIALLREVDGKVLGLISAPGSVEVSPAVNNGILFVASGAKLVAFDLLSILEQPASNETKPLWTVESVNGDIVQPLLVNREAIYLVTRDDKRETLTAISQVNGAALWNWSVTFGERVLPPVLLEEQLLVITTTGQAQTLNTSSGRVTGTLHLNRQVNDRVSPYVFSNQALYVDSNNEVFKIIGNKTGLRPAVDIYSHGQRISSVVANENYIVLGHSAGVTLLDSYGHLKWSDTDAESVSVTAILAGDSFLVLDDVGYIRWYNVLQSNPVRRIKALPGEVSTPPLMIRKRLVAVNSEGTVAFIEWR